METKDGEQLSEGAAPAEEPWIFHDLAKHFSSMIDAADALFPQEDDAEADRTPKGRQAARAAFAAQYTELRTYLADTSKEPALSAARRVLPLIAEIVANITRAAKSGEAQCEAVGDLDDVADGVVAATRSAELDVRYPASSRVPVVVLTGFLGAGKTTLLNRILSEQHGMRIAVIENEFGEISIDESLVRARVALSEKDSASGAPAPELVEMNNGCMCCTVREDLVRACHDLLDRSDKLDYIIIETTGLANPGPIIQTFFADELLAHRARIDGVVTVVDAKHALQHLSEKKEAGVVNEAAQQVAFADRVILNKTDLVTPEQLSEVKDVVRDINESVQIFPAVKSNVDLKHVLDIRAFELERILSFDPTVIGSEDNHDHDEEHCHDPDCEEHKCKKHKHEHDHEHEHEHDHEHDHGHEKEGKKHHEGKKHKENKKPKKHHDQAVSSVAVVVDGDLDGDKFSEWLSNFLQINGEKVFRMKGVVAMSGNESKWVFQGVHQMLDSSPLSEWGPDEKHQSRMVFIGRDLNKAAIVEQVKSCSA